MTGAARPTPWWRSAVVYQVYLPSFADGSGDGIGDIAGLLDRLSHVVDLGVDAVWISPWFRSPMRDGGYDIADHRDIDPTFGTTADALALIDRCHRDGLRVIVDLVANHTSTEHPWFRDALSAPPGSPARQRYHFRPGRGPTGEEPPNNWISAFGGPAWTRVTEPDGRPGEWYLHLFSPHQPDLNWDCPAVAAEYDDIIRYWLDAGVDGIRVDAASALAKHEDLPAVDFDLSTGFTPRSWPPTPFWDAEGVHEILRRWRAVADEYPGDRWLVGEVVVSTPDRLAAYLRPDELHSGFAFDLLHAPWDASAMRTAIDRSLAAVDRHPGAGTLTWVLSNHDETRHVTRYGVVETDGGRHLDLEVGTARARAALLLLLALPGATCLYQGEELGLPEVLDIPAERRRDPAFHRTGGAVPGRDGARVPLPWAGEQPPFGFSAVEPWLPQPHDWSSLSVAAQQGRPTSTLTLHRDALRLRHRLLGPNDAPLRWCESPPGTLAFERPGELTCVVNLTADPVALERPPVLCSTAQDDATLLPADAAAWLVGQTSWEISKR
jgi:alpha-glucosidase